jgi:hypothetical protein
MSKMELLQELRDDFQRSNLIRRKDRVTAQQRGQMNQKSGLGKQERIGRVGSAGPS